MKIMDHKINPKLIEKSGLFQDLKKINSSKVNLPQDLPEKQLLQSILFLRDQSTQSPTLVISTKIK